MNKDKSIYDYLKSRKASLLDRAHAYLTVFFCGGSTNAWNHVIARNNLQLAAKLSKCKISSKGVNTFVFFTAVDKNLDLMAEILISGIDPNQKYSNNYCDHIIHRMATSGCIDAVDLLIDLGADLNVYDGNFFTPLYCALKGWGEKVAPWEYRKKVVLKLLERGADPLILIGTRKDVPILYDIPMDLDIIKILLDRGVKSSWIYNGEEKTQESILFDFVLTVKEIEDLDRGLKLFADYNLTSSFKDLKGNNALFYWIENPYSRNKLEDDCDAIKVFIDNGYDLLTTDFEGNNIWHKLFNGICKPNLDLVDFFLEKDEVTSLLHKPNNNQIFPIDILKKEIDKKNNNKYNKNKSLEIIAKIQKYIIQSSIEEHINISLSDDNTTKDITKENADTSKNIYNIDTIGKDRKSLPVRKRKI